MIQFKSMENFQYDQFSLGDYFRTKSEPKGFRNLKTFVVRHFTFSNNLNMSLDLSTTKKQEDDFKDSFVKEIKDVLDFYFMLNLGDKTKNGHETYDGCLATAHANESLRKDS